MEPLKILIADSQEEFRNALAEALADAGQVRTTADGLEALDLFPGFDPDILVLDTMLPGMDGLTLTETLLQQGFHPGILAVTRHNGAYFLRTCERLPISYVMIKPCRVDAVVARILDMAQMGQSQHLIPPDTRERLADCLADLGLPARRDGYSYLRDAILMTLQDPRQTVTKHLYPTLAKQHNTNANCVEHSIRNLLHKSWEKRNDAVWRSYFPTPAERQVPRPSNQEFICHIAELLTLKRKEK